MTFIDNTFVSQKLFYRFFRGNSCNKRLNWDFLSQVIKSWSMRNCLTQPKWIGFESTLDDRFMPPPPLHRSAARVIKDFGDWCRVSGQLQDAKHRKARWHMRWSTINSHKKPSLIAIGYQFSFTTKPKSSIQESVLLRLRGNKIFWLYF